MKTNSPREDEWRSFRKKKEEEDEEGKVVEIERSFRRSYQIEILSIQPCRPSTTQYIYNTVQRITISIVEIDWRRYCKYDARRRVFRIFEWSPEILFSKGNLSFQKLFSPSLVYFIIDIFFFFQIIEFVPTSLSTGRIIE